MEKGRVNECPLSSHSGRYVGQMVGLRKDRLSPVLHFVTSKAYSITLNNLFLYYIQIIKPSCICKQMMLFSELSSLFCDISAILM